METVTKRLYEGMFLVDSVQAANDWEGTNAAIKTVLERADAEIVSLRKWNECKLAYGIDHKERGTYLLCYFRAAGEKISALERDVQLSEQIMRVLVLNAEHMTTEDIEKDTPSVRAEKMQAKATEAAEAAKAAKELEAQAKPEEAAVEADVAEEKPEAVVEDAVEEKPEAVAEDVVEEKSEAVVEDVVEEKADDEGKV